LANVLKNEIQFIQIKEILSFIWRVKVQTKPQKDRVECSMPYIQMPIENYYFETELNSPFQMWRK